MSAVRRISLPTREAPAEGVVCPECGQPAPVGFAQCGRCGEALFQPQHLQMHGTGQFSQRVRRGENTPAVASYLRTNDYPIGDSPERYWRRRRREEARERRRRRRWEQADG